jgi:hypothetical protein
MAWVIPTAQNVMDGWNDAESSKFTTLLASSGNPLPDIGQQAIQEIRSALRNGGMTLDYAGSIDDSLIFTWVAIVRYRLINRLGGQMLQTESRKKEYEEAMNTLQKCREGQWGVAAPVNPTSELTQTPGQPATYTPYARFGPCSEYGW